MLSIYGTNGVGEVPPPHPVISKLSPSCFCVRRCHLFIYIFLHYSITHLSDHVADGVVGDPPGVLHVCVLGPRCQVSQGQGYLETRFQWLPEVRGILGDSGGQPLDNLIEHGGRHPHEVLEGPGVFISEFHHEPVIHAQLYSSSDPGSHPDGLGISSLSSPSPLDEVVHLDHLLLV